MVRDMYFSIVTNIDNGLEINNQLVYLQTCTLLVTFR